MWWTTTPSRFQKKARPPGAGSTARVDPKSSEPPGTRGRVACESGPNGDVAPVRPAQKNDHVAEKKFVGPGEGACGESTGRCNYD